MPNKKQLTWASFAIAIMFTALTGCTNDDTQATDKSTAGKNALAALREATGISGTNTISIPAHPGTAMRNADGSYELTDFIIDMDYIKQTIVDEKITYSFSIMPKVVTSKNDFNLIVYNNGTGWEYSIMELVHDPTVAAVDPDNFKGTMKELYSSTARGTGCTTIFAEYHHCTHTGPCADGTCDGCSLCVDYKSFRLCRLDSEAYLTAVLIETPNNGGGGGSTEITVTPGGFIFDPNVKVSDALTIRKERSIAFYNNLSTEQQQWAQTHEDSYLSLLNYLLDHFNITEEFYTTEMIDSFIVSNGEYSGDGFMGDDDESNEEYSGPKVNIPQNIVLNDGSVVTVIFGSTESDNQSANQPVSPDLVAAVKHALNEANENLSPSNKINSIYIKATSNGSHGPKSNHYQGTALDLSRINGNKIVTLGNNLQVQALQEGFESYEHIRENFGPSFKHKTYADGTVDPAYNIGGHQDHIHVSVQSN